MSDHTDFEELEQIPWAALAAKTTDPRRSYLAVAAVALTAVAVIAWLLLRSNAPSAAAAPAETTTTTGPQVTSTVATTAPAVYSEADLMAIDVTGEERLAVMHAEWLVRDLLTVDDDPVVADRIAELLPGVEPGDTASYVEWAEAFSTCSETPGRYRVEVVYRILVEGDTGYVRQPAAAMAVELSMDVDGTAHLEAEPEPVPVPEIDGLDE